MDLDIKLQVALVAGVTAAFSSGIFSLLAVTLKDFVAPFLTKKTNADEVSNEVFRKYAEPLSAVSTTLFWRLKETLSKNGRGFFMAAVEPRSVFERYKLFSTYYRLAAMLGCIRALQRELLYFRVRQERVDAIESSLNAFEKALADGHEVELQRLNGLLNLWNAAIVKKEQEVHLGVDVERVKRTWMSKRQEISETELSKKDQRILIKEVASVIEPYINTTIPESIQDATASQAIRWLFIKQAWLYRDWQSSIGDMMIKPANAGNRSFDIIGFGEFEEMIANPTISQYRNLERLACIFDGLDIDKEDPFDARGVLIRKIYKATADLIFALSSTDYSKYLINDETLDEVRVIINANVKT